MNLNQGKRHKQAVQVLNKVEYDSEGNPIGMMEDPSNPTSANFGTPREPRRGGCYKGDGSKQTRIDIPSTFYMSNRKIFCISYWAYYSTDAPYSISRTVLSNRTGYQDGQTEVRGNVLHTNIFGDNSTSINAQMIYDEWHHVILQMDFINGIANSYINGEKYSQRNISLDGYPRTDVSSYVLMKTKNRTNELLDTNDKIFGFCIQDKFLSDKEAYSLYKNSFPGGSYILKYNCSENSGDICYDSSGNGHHGTIINAITTTPEENPNSIHQYQDVYSFENEEGFSLSNIVDSNRPIITPSRTFNDGDYVECSIKTVDQSFVILSSLPSFQYPFAVDDSTQMAGRADYFRDIVLLIDGIEYNRLTTTRNYLRLLLSDGEWHHIKIIFTSTQTRNIEFANYMFPAYPYSSWGYTGLMTNMRIYHAGILYDYTYKSLTPKNSSITLPPFKDVLGNNLQYVGKVPGKAKFVDSSCFLSDGNAYLSGDVLTTDTITAHSESEVPVCTIDGRLDFPTVGGKYFDIRIERGGSVITRLPLCEPIIDPSNHIYHDVSGNGNHATLINGTLANEGKQDEFHYLQKGFGRGGSINKFVSWSTPTNITLTNNAGLAPDGSNTAMLLTETLTNEPVRHYNTFSTASPKPYPVVSHSIYAKYNGRRYLSIGSWGWSVELFCIVDLLEGKIVWERYNRLTKIRAEITILPDGWIRLIQEGYNNATEGTPQSYHVGLSNSSNPIPSHHYQPPAYVGDGASGAYIWNLKIRDSETEVVPLIENSVWDVYGDYMAVPQDSHSFLNTGTELEAYDYPTLKQADKDDDFWYEDDGLGVVTPKPVQFDSLITQNGLSDKLFLDSSVSGTIKNVRMYGSDLKGRQLNTENKLTNS